MYSFRYCVISIFLIFIFGCATSSKITPEDLKSLAPNEGVAIGSVIIRGGDDLLGRTEWELVAKDNNDSSMFPDNYSIIANRDGDEKIFALKIPAGNYTFFVLSQSGFSTFKSKMNLSFTVQPTEPVYIGRIIIEFPPGYITAFTNIRYKVVDAKDDVAENVKNIYGISLIKTDTSIAFSGSAHATANQLSSQYGGIKKGMNASEVSNELGAPVQKHQAPNKVFGIDVISGAALWEYHAGANYIEAIWLVKFENEKVIDLGRSQGEILSNIKFGYLIE